MTTETGSQVGADAAGAAPSLTSRVPGHAVLAELLRAQAALPPRSQNSRNESMPKRSLWETEDFELCARRAKKASHSNSSGAPVAL